MLVNRMVGLSVKNGHDSVLRQNTHCVSFVPDVIFRKNTNPVTFEDFFPVSGCALRMIHDEARLEILLKSSRFPLHLNDMKKKKKTFLITFHSLVSQTWQ